MNHFKILKEFQGCLSIQLSKNFIKCYQLSRRQLNQDIIAVLVCQELFYFFVIFFQSDNILYINPFYQHYLHQLLVHYAHKRLWQIKSHSYLMNGFSGEDGIRTHAPVKTNGFQDRPVMTTSVPLHSYFIVSHQRLDYIIITPFICQHSF